MVLFIEAMAHKIREPTSIEEEICEGNYRINITSDEPSQRLWLLYYVDPRATDSINKTLIQNSGAITKTIQMHLCN